MKTLEEIRELANEYLHNKGGSATITQMYEEQQSFINGYLKAQEELFSEEDMINFAEFIGNYHKCQGGWWHIYTSQTIENIKTTKDLLEIYKQNK